MRFILYGYAACNGNGVRVFSYFAFTGLWNCAYCKVRILSVIPGIIILVVPGLKAMTTGMLLYIMAGWFVIQGIVSIVRAVKVKKEGGSSMWIWGICSGVLCILMGVYSAVHPVVLALTMGLMVGLYFIVSGINMITMSTKIEE